MPPLSLLLKPASSACNLRCDYCFYADEAQKRRIANYGVMPEEVARAVIKKSLAAAEGTVSFLFQGGGADSGGAGFLPPVHCPGGGVCSQGAGGSLCHTDQRYAAG